MFRAHRPVGLQVTESQGNLTKRNVFSEKPRSSLASSQIGAQNSNPDILVWFLSHFRFLSVSLSSALPSRSTSSAPGAKTAVAAPGSMFLLGTPPPQGSHKALA